MKVLFTTCFIVFFISSCTIHQPFTHEPLICFKKKCRARKVIARRITKNRPSGKKHKASFNEKYVALSKDTITSPSQNKVFFTPDDVQLAALVPDTIVIHINFEFNSYQLNAVDKRAILPLLEKMKDPVYSSILICGHTDDVGSEEYNKTLSENRANHVKHFLLEEGFPQQKLSAVGYGSEVPLNPNETEEQRRLNRRVEFILYKQ